MTRERKRFVRRPPDLTSLFDVLFIVVFVALIRAAAAEQTLARASEPPPPAPPAPVEPPPAPLSADVTMLKEHALSSLHADLDARSPIVVRIAAPPVAADNPDATLEARITAIEIGGERIAMDSPLIERDPRVNFAYLGNRAAELRLCKLAATRANLPDLSRHFVIVAPTLPLRELPRALTEGLAADVARCSDLRGLASIVDPAVLPKADPPGSATPAPRSP